jgi:hypothetical protein
MRRWISALWERWTGFDFTLPNVMADPVQEDWMGVPVGASS